MSRTPDVRFKGFEKEWEHHSLRDFGSVAMCKRIFKDQTNSDGDIPFYKIGTFGGDPDAYISKDLFEQYRNAFPYPEKGDALISASGSIGRTVVFDGKPSYFQDSNIVWLKHDNRITNPFLAQLYHVVNWGGLEGSTIKRLYNENILNTETDIPEIDEQKTIACFLTNLDTLIEQNQSEVDRLRNLKKAMLLKMFPQKGSKVPEIRFKGFSGDWETKPFKSIAARVTDFDSDARLPHVEYEDLNAGEGTLNKDLSKKECNKKGLVFDKGDVLYGKLRPYLHNWLLPTFKGIAVGDFWVLRPVETDAGFLFCLIRTADYDTVANQSSGTKMPRADWKLVSATEFQIPKSIDEQRLIGQYFQNLDSLIEQRQSNTDRLRHLKQAMLQRMFV